MRVLEWVNFCPKCGKKKIKDASYCGNCRFDFTTISKNTVEQASSKPLKTKNSSVLFLFVNFSMNTIYVFWLGCIYLIAKEMLFRGTISDVVFIITPIILTLVFYAISLFLYYKRGSKVFWIATAISFIMYPGIFTFNGLYRV